MRNKKSTDDNSHQPQQQLWLWLWALVLLCWLCRCCWPCCCCCRCRWLLVLVLVLRFSCCCFEVCLTAQVVVTTSSMTCKRCFACVLFAFHLRFNKTDGLLVLILWVSESLEFLKFLPILNPWVILFGFEQVRRGVQTFSWSYYFHFCSSFYASDMTRSTGFVFAFILLIRLQLLFVSFLFYCCSCLHLSS